MRLQSSLARFGVATTLTRARTHSYTGVSQQVATINDVKYRSVNRNATAGSPQDIYKHNPWRAPGTAPVGDACGLAGGTPWLPEVPEAGDYTKTKFAHHGVCCTMSFVGCTSLVACCMASLACCMLHVACCMSSHSACDALYMACRMLRVACAKGA